MKQLARAALRGLAALTPNSIRGSAWTLGRRRTGVHLRGTQAATWHRPVTAAGPKSQPASLLSIIIALLGATYFYSGFSEYALNYNLLPVTPGQVIVLTVGLGGVIGFLHMSDGRSLPWGLIVVAILYLALIGLNVTYNDHTPTVVRSRIAYMLALVAFALAVRGTRNFNSLVLALTWATITACLMNFIDYLARGILPFEMSPIPGRAAGFHVNPNISATYIALSIPIICAMVRRKSAILIYALTFFGTLVTFSRSGMLLWIAAVFMTETAIRNRLPLGPHTAIVAVIFGLVATSLVAFGHIAVDEFGDLLGGYLSPSARSRVSLETHDYAAQQRLYGARAAWDLFLAYPWTGSGLGLPGRWQFNEMSHNMILQTLAEFGVLGGAWLGIFALWLTKIRGPFGMTFTLLWTVTAMFSHNLFDQMPMAVITAFYLAGAERSKAIYQQSGGEPNYFRLRAHSRSVAA